MSGGVILPLWKTHKFDKLHKTGDESPSIEKTGQFALRENGDRSRHTQRGTSMSTLKLDSSAPSSVHSLSTDGSRSGEFVRANAGSWFRLVVQRLGTREFHRRMWHTLPGFLPFLLWPIPHQDPVSIRLQSIILAICAGLGLSVIIQYRRISRHIDAGPVSCTLGYAGSFAAAVLLFPSALEIAFAVLAILAFGDGSATLFGNLLPKKPLPWNRGKSWGGFLAFIAVALPMAAFAYWGESNNLEAAQPGVSLGVAFLCVSLPVVASSVVESIRSRLNDNIRVGIVALAGMAAAHSAIVGW
jgi:phytol kinase